jgi:hypothetical protein
MAWLTAWNRRRIAQGNERRQEKWRRILDKVQADDDGEDRE